MYAILETITESPGLLNGRLNFSGHAQNGTRKTSVPAHVRTFTHLRNRLRRLGGILEWVHEGVSTPRFSRDYLTRSQ